MSVDETSAATGRRQLLLLGAGALAYGTAAPALSASRQPRAAMRYPARQRAAAPGPSMGETPPLAVIALNRMAFGPRPGDVEAFEAAGLSAWVEQQLDPASIDDSEADSRIAAAGFETLDKTIEELWLDHWINWGGDTDVKRQPFNETVLVTLLRATYSKRQLVEVLADFWHNHFNIYGKTSRQQSTFVQHDRDAIRPNLLGNFRTMLEGVGAGTSMLYYLHNFDNSDDGPNEDYARELFELHGLGAENYLGVMPQSEVPLDGNGVPVGYVDEDVYETARCFTGWTVANSDTGPGGNTGAFLYRDDWHDRFQKHVLGAVLPSDQAPMKDGRDVYDLLASHPGTARHICRKLCRRFVSDDPPQSLVDQAAAVFEAQWQAPDQLEQVMRTILLSPEFSSTWGEKVKRPFEILVAALRATEAEFAFSLADGSTSDLRLHYNRASQPLFERVTPDGYPDVREDWLSSASRVMAWRLCNWLVAVTDGAGSDHLDILGQTPAGVRSANALADFWIDRILGRTMSDEDRGEIVDFMAQGRNPDLDLPVDTDTDTRERVRMMVSLIFMSPEFLWR